ncbi:MAG: hypothetical protein UX53_C0034G0006 [Candidatus Azambacteria bacterium GW2011_GWB2_46_37]|nr:MAG: hypothetical protein UX33_C0034G0007 [Candidatus Azambacteria bacterium GW2011_GWC1_46_13]KKU37309.1 MAG: hypothetical protein UX51_C0025G0012 [Candidatus Azambacteria bacterium GW2011_GWF2_46_32]KKU38191.1 MAG: hypothetical protein UX53_C0034G0006 [Candidatus Azambacteria bacterium GW2011_GWB2_46_37]KKU39668.1 MAG: hypothetical protein UX55_C0032G0005 [Candidatus Azambacteria bacterium GW2011_GWE2_46_45]
MNPVRGRDRAAYHHCHLMLNYNYKIIKIAGSDFKIAICL